MMITWLRLAVALLVTTPASIEAFAPPQTQRQRQQNQQAAASFVDDNNKRQLTLASTTTTAAPTTDVDKQRLTEHDEEVLFGGEGERDSAVVSSSHHERRKDKFGNILVDRTSHPNPLDHAQDPLINKLHTMRETLQSCPELWLELGKICPDLRAVLDEYSCDTVIDQTFADFARTVQKSATVFQNLGVKKGTHVALLGENSAVWLAVDQGIQLAGGATAVRGAEAPVDELRYIYEHSESAALVVLQGPRLLQKLVTTAADNSNKGGNGNKTLGLFNEKYGPVQTVVLMNREKKSNEEIAQLASALNLNIYVYDDLLAQAHSLASEARPKLLKSDLATIVYTSGTTGHPKGVMLSQGNLLHQMGHRLAPSKPYEESEPLPGESMVSLLPGTCRTTVVVNLYY